MKHGRPMAIFISIAAVWKKMTSSLAWISRERGYLFRTGPATAWWHDVWLARVGRGQSVPSWWRRTMTHLNPFLSHRRSGANGRTSFNLQNQPPAARFSLATWLLRLPGSNGTSLVRLLASHQSTKTTTVSDYFLAFKFDFFASSIFLPYGCKIEWWFLKKWISTVHTMQTCQFAVRFNPDDNLLRLRQHPEPTNIIQ